MSANIFLRKHVSIFMRDIVLLFFFLVLSIFFSGFVMRVIMASQDELRSVLSSWIFWKKKLYKIDFNSFLSIW